jgi:hypothetical protein
MNQRREIIIFGNKYFGNISAAEAEIGQSIIGQTLEFRYILTAGKDGQAVPVPPDDVGNVAEIIFKKPSGIVAARRDDAVKPGEEILVPGHLPVPPVVDRTQQRQNGREQITV